MKKKKHKKKIVIAIKVPMEDEVILKKIKVKNVISDDEIISKIAKYLCKGKDLSSIDVRYIFDSVALIYNNKANIDDNLNFIYEGDEIIFGTTAFIHYDVIYHEDIDDFDVIYSDITKEDLNYLAKKL